MRLQMLRHRPAPPAEPAAAHGIVAAEAPEIKAGARVHRGEHRPQRANRPGQGIVHEHDLVIGVERRAPQAVQRRLVGPDVETGVLALEQAHAGALRPGAAFGVQAAVCDKKDGLRLPEHRAHRKTAGLVSLPAGVVVEVDHKPFFHRVSLLSQSS